MVDKRVKLTFLGTGTSMGVPVAGNFSAHPPSNDPRDYRMRCSAWVEVKGKSILIDIGPEFRLQTLRSGLNRIDLLLLTHEHIDHVGGLDDLRPFNYVQEQSIPVFTTASCKASVEARYEYMFEPNKIPGSVSVDISVLEKSIQWNDITITPLPIKHGSLDLYGYRIENLSYITDVNYIPSSTKELIKGSKILILSGLRWSPEHKTHYTIPQAIEIANELEIPQVYLIHMSSFVMHELASEKLPPNVKLAFDLQTIYCD